MITYSVKNGIILLVMNLISPMGSPLLAVQGLGKLQDVNASGMKTTIKESAQAGGYRSALFF